MKHYTSDNCLKLFLVKQQPLIASIGIVYLLIRNVAKVDQFQGSYPPSMLVSGVAFY
jgi:hypothetical protein